jgi:glycosyltransferase involved in cell wall biosynthesis
VKTERLIAVKKQPISFFIPGLQGGGAQRVVVNLANILPDITEHPIHVVLARKEGEFLDELRPEVQIIDLGTKRASRSVFALAGYMRRERPQAMISTLNYANVMFLISGLLAGKPCPLIVREATVVRKPSGSLGDKLRGHITQTLMRLLYPRAAKVIAISRDVQQSLLDAGIKIHDKLALIGNPVEIESPKKEPGDLSWLPSPPPPFICSIGRLSEPKGFDVLLTAFAKLDDNRMHLVILGEGPLRESLTQQARDLGIDDRVHLPGFVKQPRQVLEKAELFVLSSRWEGFVNVLMEALATGVPVVSTDCPGSPGDILENGACGHLVQHDDPHALAEGIIKALEQPAGTPASRMARATDFSAEKIAREYLKEALLPDGQSWHG